MIDYQRSVEEDRLIQQWHTRQLDLANLLQSYNLMSCVPEVDWTTNKIKWAKDGYVVSAKIRQLCRYSPNHRLLSIAIPNNFNGSLLPKLPEYAEECDENGAWLWALHVAEAEEAQYVYRLKVPYTVLFLGLWELQVSNSVGRLDPVALDDQYVAELLEELQLVLQKKHQEPAFISRFFINSGDSILRHAEHFKDSASQHRLRQIGNSLRTMGKSFGQARFGFLPPRPLSEGKLEELNRELSHLHTDWHSERQGASQVSSNLSIAF